MRAPFRDSGTGPVTFCSRFSRTVRLLPFRLPQSPQLKAWHWRKSSQWFGLLRRHVEVVLQDVDVFRR